MKLSGAPAIFDLDPYANSAYQEHQLGSMAVDRYGDCYRYTYLQSDVSAGYLLVSKARQANHQNIALSAAASVGASYVSPTLGATACAANEYAGGWLAFNDVSPEGTGYRITRNTVSAAGSEAIDVYIYPKLKEAATTSSEVSLVRNPWHTPAVSQLIAERACGVTMYDWDYSEKPYGWLKTRGMAQVLVDTSGVTVGYKATISDQVNGSVGVYSDVDAEFEVGQMMATGTATEFNPIWLTID